MSNTSKSKTLKKARAKSIEFKCRHGYSRTGKNILSFTSTPGSNLPTNIHAITGLNAGAALAQVAADLKKGTFDLVLSISASPFQPHIATDLPRIVVDLSKHTSKNGIYIDTATKKLLKDKPGFYELSGEDSQTRLVTEMVQNLRDELVPRTLVLIHEPETHLGAELLTTFMHVLSTLISKDKDSVAVVTTNSPIVIQQIPRGCMWVLRGLGIAHRPIEETFGDDLGSINRKVLGLPIEHDLGYRVHLRKAAKGLTYEKALKALGGQLGLAARFEIQDMTEKESLT